MIKIGKFDLDVPADTQLYLESQVDFPVILLKDGKPSAMLGTSKDRVWKGKFHEDVTIRVDVPKLMHTGIDARVIRPPGEVVSDIPVEVDVDQGPVDLQTQIKRFCAELVQNEFGRDSAQVDTFEEMMDFDIPDDDDILSGFEVEDMTPEEVLARNEVPTPEEPVEPPAEEPPPEAEPAA